MAFLSNNIHGWHKLVQIRTGADVINCVTSADGLTLIMSMWKSYWTDLPAPDDPCISYLRRRRVLPPALGTALSSKAARWKSNDAKMSWSKRDAANQLWSAMLPIQWSCPMLWWHCNVNWWSNNWCNNGDDGPAFQSSYAWDPDVPVYTQWCSMGLCASPQDIGLGSQLESYAVHPALLHMTTHETGVMQHILQCFSSQVYQGHVRSASRWALILYTLTCY